MEDPVDEKWRRNRGRLVASVHPLRRLIAAVSEEVAAGLRVIFGRFWEIPKQYDNQDPHDEC